MLPWFRLRWYGAAAWLAFGSVASGAQPQSTAEALPVNQKVWDQFSPTEKMDLLIRFPNLELIPIEAIGIIHSVQLVNRSSPGTDAGRTLGSALGQSLYIDRTLRGAGNRYSSTSQLGAAVAGATLGSTLDSSPSVRFIINYGVRTLDGQIREQQVVTSEQITRPVGQCVKLPEVRPAPAQLCSDDKGAFLGRLSALAQTPAGSILSKEVTGISVNCKIGGVGVMTLERSACQQLHGIEER